MARPYDVVSTSLERGKVRRRCTHMLIAVLVFSSAACATLKGEAVVLGCSWRR